MATFVDGGIILFVKVSYWRCACKLSSVPRHQGVEGPSHDSTSTHHRRALDCSTESYMYMDSFGLWLARVNLDSTQIRARSLLVDGWLRAWVLARSLLSLTAGEMCYLIQAR